MWKGTRGDVHWNVQVAGVRDIFNADVGHCELKIDENTPDAKEMVHCHEEGERKLSKHVQGNAEQ